MKTKYQGMSYEQASREGQKLVIEAAHSGIWHSIVEDLADLKRLMLTLRGPYTVKDGTLHLTNVTVTRCNQ